MNLNNHEWWPRALEATRNLMTPKHLIEMTELPPAMKILPNLCIDFESLLTWREEIRNLRILPVKHDAERERYSKLKPTLLLDLLEKMGDKDILYLQNQFPYFLPPDVEQGIYWIKDGVSDDRVIEFIAATTAQAMYTPDEMIYFERPRTISTPLVKGSFPSMRHIHSWCKKIICDPS